jgi:Domain of unknown function (DUF4389)
MDESYPLTYDVDYPDRDLDRVTSFFRFFTVIPIAIVLGTVDGAAGSEWGSRGYLAAGLITAGGILFGGPLLMILFRGKYPRWWFDWNRELLRFTHRVGAYFALQSDEYPSTDEQQYVHLEIEYPNVEEDLSRGMPLIKWFLAIPHYFVLIFLGIGAFFVLIYAWFAILFTGRYPRGAFDYLVGVTRWWLRVVAYAAILTTDKYPPFSLEP